MKYLKTYENNFHLKPDNNDIECLEEIKMIFNDIAEENNYYHEKINEEGVYYKYLTWDDEGLSYLIINNMLKQKYFRQSIIIRENKRCPKISTNKVLYYIEENFIQRIESIGYKVFKTVRNNDNDNFYVYILSLKIDYSEV